jgi:hypothetical protein
VSHAGKVLWDEEGDLASDKRALCRRRSALRRGGVGGKTFQVFTAAAGGSQHCQRDCLSLGNSVIFDWLAEKL